MAAQEGVLSRSAVFKGYINQDGERVYTEPARELKFRIQNKGKRFREDIEAEGPTRSNGWNRYYWKVVIQEHVCELLEAFLGEPVHKDDAHAWCKLRFLPTPSVDGTPVPRGSASLSNDEFKAYCDDIRHYWFHKCGASIPEPNENEVSL
jgi:hypothetical protein